MIGEFPGLASGLDEQGNLRATADFRGVYSALIEQVARHRRCPRDPERGLVRATRPAAMRRLAVAALILVAGAAPASASAPPPARLQVAAKEFSLTLSRFEAEVRLGDRRAGELR